MRSLFRLLLTAQTDADLSSTQSMTDMLDLLLIVMFIGAGIYCVYTFIRLRRECMLFDNKVLYPGDCKYTDCADPEGFMDYIQYRILILGAFLVLCGIFFLLNLYVLSVSAVWITILQFAVPIGGFAWYVVVQRRAAKRYW